MINILDIPGEHHAGYDTPAGCFPNVARLVRDKGGKAVMGWLVHDKGDWLQLIHHAVWQRPDGRVVDPTPQPNPDLSESMKAAVATLDKSVPFLPDTTATLLAGRTRPCRYLPARRKYKRAAELMERYEVALLAEDWALAASLSRAVYKEKALAWGICGRGAFTRRVADKLPRPELRRYKNTDADLLPYLTA